MRDDDASGTRRRLVEQLQDQKVALSTSVAQWVELEGARARFNVAEEELRSAKARLTSAENTLECAVARLDQAEEAVVASVREGRAIRAGDKTGVLTHIGGRVA